MIIRPHRNVLLGVVEVRFLDGAAVLVEGHAEVQAPRMVDTNLHVVVQSPSKTEMSSELSP